MVHFHFKSVIAQPSTHMTYQRLELTTVKVYYNSTSIKS